MRDVATPKLSFLGRLPSPASRPLPFLAALILFAGIRAAAQTDEIQVYDGSIAAPREFTLTLHANYVASGLTQSAFPGAVIANHSLNGALEWAFGATDWFEAGLYLPVWSRDAESGLGYDGFKLRALFVSPHADARTFAYGVNLEFSVNQPRWDASRYTGEIRTIITWHFAAMDLILNPIFDTAFDGFSNLDFAPCARLDYNVNPKWTLALEQYSDFGPVTGFHSWSEQSHQLFAVVDRHWTRWEAEFGVGAGLTGASDPWTLELLVTTSLDRK